MTAVYSTRLFDAHSLVLAEHFTVPAGKVCIVRDIDVFFTALSAGNVNIVTPADGTFAYFSYVPSEPALQSWRGRQVFVAGEEVGVLPDFVTGECDVTISGYLLDAP
jgi:hypothetical protein